MWELLRLPVTYRRIRAFSIPAGDEMVIWSATALSLIHLAPRISLRRVCSGREAQKLFHPKRGGIVYRGRVYLVDGECGPQGQIYGDIRRCDLTSGEYLEVLPRREELLIRDASGRVQQVIEDFPVQSQRWAVAGFSEDGRYLAVGHPGRVRVFRRCDHPAG